ncbi:MAG: efflux RND transporter permease subunit [Candidatus Sericytochromatia bacterium]|nr:efflux RND transporter permease subunit [Candidatus Sericytochromatia bacterium]
MNISAWAIKRPIPVILLFLVLTLLGLSSYLKLGINDNPDVDFPLVVVSITQAGASPAELETEVTRKVEDALVGITGLDHITSTISEGLSLTSCEFKIGTQTDKALNDVRDAVAKVRQTLPGDINEPSITQPNFSGEPFITYTVASERRSVADLSRLIDEDITRALLTVPGVAQVKRSGGLTREVRVELDPARLRALGLNVEGVNAQLRQLNVNLPGGRAEAGGQEQSIRTLGSAPSVEALRNFPIRMENGQTVPLATLGHVEDGYAEVRQKAFLNGRPCVAFSVVRSQSSALVQTEAATREAVHDLAKTLPADVKVELVSTLADFTRDAHTATMDALYMGAALAVIVIFIFLRNGPAVLISALAIPLSVIATFWVMKMLGYTLNGMTTLALTLVVGILVDDAIVDLENIYRHIGMGKSPMKAALEATDEIGLAIVATTMTIVAVFIPVGFMGGIPGMFFRSFGVTVAVAVLFSLLVARTLTPMLAAYLLPRTLVHAEDRSTYRKHYLRALDWALAHRWKTLGGATLVFFASLALIPILPKGFITLGDIGQATVQISLPSGATIDDTESVVKQVEALLSSRPESKLLFSTVGTASNSAGGSLVQTGTSVTRASVNVVLTPRAERSVSLDDFQNSLRDALTRIPGARVAFAQFGATGSAKPVNILLRGANGLQLERVGEQLLREMRALPELRDVTSSTAELRPEVQIRPRLIEAAEQGVSVADIGRTVRLGTQGDVDFNLAKFNAGNRQVNIRVQLQSEARGNLSSIGDLLIVGRYGPIPLRTVADISFGTGPVQIDRYDRARQITFTANLTQGNLGDALAKIQRLPTLQNLPAGINQGTVGDSKIMIDIFTETVLALGAGIMFIYVVLILLFGGFLQPLTIMMALPLSFGGALAGLLVFGKELGLYALIGVIMLMGLVTKNSILLVEYALMARQKGADRKDALLQAGRDRLRPILMTTIAMIAGMLPIALEIGTGTEVLSPMAVAVIGGLITSTAFTLIVIPAVFTIIDDVQVGMWNIWRRLSPFKEVTEPEPHPPDEGVA